MENIPISELVRYLNQVDIFNFVLINKNIHQLYQPYLNEFKAFYSTKANRLLIYVSYKPLIYSVSYFFNQGFEFHKMGDHFTYERKFESQIEAISKIIDQIIPMVPIKDGDFVKCFSDIFGGTAEDPLLFTSYLYKTDKIKAVQNISNWGTTYEIYTKDYSIHHWSNVFNVIMFHSSLMVPYFESPNKLLYVEIDFGKYRLRINYTKKNDVIWNNNLYLIADYITGKYIIHYQY